MISPEELQRLTEINFLGWSRVKSILDTGVKFTFNKHQYLKGIYSDTGKHIVLRKAAQLGFTCWAVLKSAWNCRYRYVTGAGYYFPTDKAVRLFVRSRVNPILKFNKDLEAMITDSIELKKIGRCYVFFQGMKTRQGVESISVDGLIFDEMDGMEQSQREAALSRISHSQFKEIIELSNSSITNYGIDAAFKEGDQKHYFSKCEKCGKETCFQKEFPKKLGLDVSHILKEKDGRVYRCCRHCGEEIQANKGRWVADIESHRDVSSYSCSQLFANENTVTAASILKSYRTTSFPQIFYAYTIGEPYETAEGRITKEEIFELCGDYYMDEFSHVPCSMGVDQGDKIHYVISRFVDGRRRYIKIGICTEWSELDQLMDAYHVSRCVVDARPEKRNALAFAAKYPRRVFCNYVQGNTIGTYRWNEDENKVTSDKVEHLDASGLMIKQKKVIFPHRSTPIMDIFASQMSTLARKLETDTKGDAFYVYVNINSSGGEVAKNADHFRNAFSYDCMAWDEGTTPTIAPPAQVMQKSKIMSRWK